MTTEQPGGDGSFEDPAGLPSVPDEVWDKFLQDSEGAIHVSGAPKEPSARERMTPPAPSPFRESVSVSAVGELWQRDEPRPGPAWQELDGRARARRVGRVLGAVAVTALILVAVRPGAAGGPSGESGTTVEQSVDLPDELPSATSTPTSPPPPDEESPDDAAHPGSEGGPQREVGPDGRPGLYLRTARNT
ncbi:hypothetical protein [Streptomyces sp. NPDC001508]|uniref:hypothetical protein n=1 Tax=Streptomyces sp. NPDC001508 TaxID=3154656 RepID=UPI003329B35C